MVALIIDHYDSYTHILAHYFWELTGNKPLTFQHDQVTIDELKKKSFDFVVFSPGPGRPELKKDFSVGYEILQYWPECPVLGVCLGHQALAFFQGAQITHAPKPKHGKISRLKCDSTHPLFAGLPEEQEVVRYHSLVVAKNSLPEALLPLAFSLDDQQLMAFQIKDRPWYGVQFHPESCGTPYGKEILRNFLKIVSKTNFQGQASTQNTFPYVLTSRSQAPSWNSTSTERPSGQSQYHYSLEQHFAKKWLSSPGAFWLDSSLQNSHHYWHVQGNSTYGISQEMGKTYEYIWENSKWLKKPLHLDLKKALEQKLTLPLKKNNSENLPYFSGGWVGAMGYEFVTNENIFKQKKSIIEQPQAFFYWVEDYDCIRADTGETFSYRNLTLASNSILPPFAPKNRGIEGFTAYSPINLALNHEEYLKSIQELQTAIRDGETYEACLTNQFWTHQPASQWECYQALRKKNPGYYGGYLALPMCAILSSSPELLLNVSTEGLVQTEPIKGTRNRDGLLATQTDLITHIKDSSELLMITDLLRNDLAKNTLPGSIQVIAHKKITELQTLYQMSSVIEGKLSPEKSALDLLFDCIPGGSISGAPKIRTMSILDSLEPIERGFYTGTMGFMDLTGKLQMNLLIRTLVADGKNLFWGGGGAIVYDSVPEMEWQEMQSKASCSNLFGGDTFSESKSKVTK